MQIIITFLFSIITILSIIIFKAKGLLTLIITVPLLIMYFKSNSIINILKNKRKDVYRYKKIEDSVACRHNVYGDNLCNTSYVYRICNRSGE